MKVVNSIQTYEVGGEECDTSDSTISVTVSSHWNREAFVVLQIGKGRNVTVVASQMRAAIDNATNAKGL